MCIRYLISYNVLLICHVFIYVAEAYSVSWFSEHLWRFRKLTVFPLDFLCQLPITAGTSKRFKLLLLSSSRKCILSCRSPIATERKSRLASTMLIRQMLSFIQPQRYQEKIFIADLSRLIVLVKEKLWQSTPLKKILRIEGNNYFTVCSRVCYIYQKFNKCICISITLKRPSVI